jgi:hypothetical protein
MDTIAQIFAGCFKQAGLGGSFADGIRLRIKHFGNGNGLGHQSKSKPMMGFPRRLKANSGDLESETLSVMSPVGDRM